MIRGIVENEVFNGPYHAEFSPTDACNYECFFCNTAFIDRSQRLAWPLLEKTLLDLIGMDLQSVRLAGGGEPLIYPQIGEFLDLCLDNRLEVTNVNTNGFRLIPKITDKFLDLDTHEFIISFNDIDPQRYASTNGTTERSYEVVLENIRYLVEQKKARGLTRPSIIQQFFLWKGNHDQIERAYDMALELGVDRVYLRDMYGIDQSKRMNAQECEVAGAAVARLLERDKENGLLEISLANEKVLDDFPTFDEQRKEWRETQSVFDVKDPSRQEYCYIAWYSTVIRGNGEVYPCCILASAPGYPTLGNIHQNSIEEIWRGEAYAKLRDELRTIAVSGGEYEGGASHCYTVDHCAMRWACPFVGGLANPEFYQEVHAELVRLRQRPAASVRRFAEGLGKYRPFVGVER